MQSVSSGFGTAISAPVRKVKEKLLIEWTRNATEIAVASVSSSGQHSATYLPDDDVANGLGESFPYAVFDSGCLADGTWFPFPEPSEAEFERGWWSNITSGAERTFTSNPWVEIVYAVSAPWRKANLVRVISTTYYPRIEQFKLWYKRSTDTDWQGGTEHTMTSAAYEVGLGSVLDLKAVKIEVTVTSEANDYARLIEVDAVWREDVSDLVKSLCIRKRREHLISATIPYGRFAACELEVDLLDESRAFKASGIYTPYMGPNLRVLPYLGVWTGSSYEYVPQGVFYTEDDWRSGEGMLIIFSARDATKFLQQREVEEHLVVSVRTDRVFKHLAHRGHERLGNMAVESFATTHPYIYSGEGSIYDALVDLAKAELATIYYDELGTLHVDNNDHFAGLSPVGTITDAVSFRIDLEEPERINYVVYRYRQAYLAPRQEIGKSSEEISVGAGQTETIIGNFNKYPAPYVSSPSIMADSEISLLSWWANGVRWSVTVGNAAGSAKKLNGIIWYGRPLAISDEKAAISKDADLIRRHEKRDLEVDPPIISMSASAAKARADAILARLKSGARVLRIQMRSMPHWQLGDVLTVNSSRAGISGNYAIQAVEIDKSNMTLELVKL